MVDDTAEIVSEKGLEAAINGNGKHQPTSDNGVKRREYIPFVTDDKKELQVAADYLQERLGQQQREGLELTVLQFPDPLSAVNFWKQHPLEVPLIIADKRYPESPTGTALKIFHSEIDPKLWTAIINPYTVRNPNASPVETINLDLFVETTLREYGEMQAHRSQGMESLTGDELASEAKSLVDTIEAYLPKFKNYLVRRESTSTKPAIAPELISHELRLTAVIKALKDNYGNRDAVSSRKVDLATESLHELLNESSPGLTYVTFSEKEGIFIPTDVLENKGQTQSPVYAIKRFQTLQQARYVHSLSQWLENRRKERQARDEVGYMQVPQTYWPLKVNGFSVIFMDAIQGQDLLTLLPKINSDIKSGSKDAESLKYNIIIAALDNLAYWQHVSPQAAKDIGNYELQPVQIRQFSRNAITDSRRTLERVTETTLSETSRTAVNEAAAELASLLSEKPALGLDSGVKNIRMTNTGGSMLSLVNVANALWSVDLPYEWRTIHKMRDVVRLLFAPAAGLNEEEINRYAAYILLRGEHLATTAIGGDAAGLEDQMGMLRSGTQTGLSVVTLERRGVYHDLYAVAAAEAARMTTIISQVFLSKVRAGMRGELKTTLSQKDLMDKFGELTTEYQMWAQVGLRATHQLERILGGEANGRIVPGLETLFSTLEKTPINPDRLPAYKPFMKV
ncbi:hypothetical protein HYY73_04930 [Candidatus Woesearchaeota archaeon]|nr:hypothetical protein [Candidatus Woesearchaeota archaeon]